jgi:hypothetical protein
VGLQTNEWYLFLVHISKEHFLCKQSCHYECSYENFVLNDTLLIYFYMFILVFKSFMFSKTFLEYILLK